MKHILIPTDFSNNAWNAAVYGLELFQEVSCTFYIMHISTITTYSGEETIIMGGRDVVLEASTKRLQKLIADLTANYPNRKHTFIAITSHNFFVEAIQNEYRERGIALIIMGTKGATGLKKVTIGSNTGNVITKVKHPILVVPENARFKKQTSIIFPTDYSINYDARVLEELVRFSALYQSDLKIIHMAQETTALDTSQTQNKAFLHQYFMDIEHSFHRIQGNRLPPALQTFCEIQDVSMIVMVAKNLNFIERMLFRSTAEKISYHTEIPFLVLHE